MKLIAVLKTLAFNYSAMQYEQFLMYYPARNAREIPKTAIKKLKP